MKFFPIKIVVRLEWTSLVVAHRNVQVEILSSMHRPSLPNAVRDHHTYRWLNICIPSFGNRIYLNAWKFYGIKTCWPSWDGCYPWPVNWLRWIVFANQRIIASRSVGWCPAATPVIRSPMGVSRRIYFVLTMIVLLLWDIEKSMFDFEPSPYFDWPLNQSFPVSWKSCGSSLPLQLGKVVEVCSLVKNWLLISIFNVDSDCFTWVVGFCKEKNISWRNCILLQLSRE